MAMQQNQLDSPQGAAQLIEDLFPLRVAELVSPRWSQSEDEPKHNGIDSGRTEALEGSSSWIEMLKSEKSSYHIGAAVLDYCMSNFNSRAFVFFSMEDATIRDRLAILAETPNVSIIYAVSLQLSEVGALNLIELCYGNKPFFTDRLRKRMTRERFVFSTKAFLVFYEPKNGTEGITELKAKLRCNLSALTFERRIHGTDGVEDTRFLVEAVTNPNSLNLLNRVEISRHDRVFSRYPATLRFNSDICVDGSATMELYGLRKSRDLDLICQDPDATAELLAMGFDVNNTHYEGLPISHEDVIVSPYLHVKLFGIKFTSLATRQLLLSFGPRSAYVSWTSKKKRDIKSIAEFTLGRHSRGVGFVGRLSTMATQLRLSFEFVVKRIMPKLPPTVARMIRSIRQRFTAS